MYELKPHRYRELKHFCLQYGDMKKELDYIRNGYLEQTFDPTSNIAVREVELEHALKLIETTAHDTDEFLADKILKVVTEDVRIRLFGGSIVGSVVWVSTSTSCMIASGRKM